MKIITLPNNNKRYKLRRQNLFYKRLSCTSHVQTMKCYSPWTTIPINYALVFQHLHHSWRKTLCCWVAAAWILFQFWYSCQVPRDSIFDSDHLKCFNSFYIDLNLHECWKLLILIQPFFFFTFFDVSNGFLIFENIIFIKTSTYYQIVFILSLVHGLLTFGFCIICLLLLPEEHFHIIFNNV